MKEILSGKRKISDIDVQQLKGIYASYSIDFKKCHGLYKKQIQKKNEEAHTNIGLVSLQAFIDYPDLRLFPAAD